MTTPKAAHTPGPWAQDEKHTGGAVAVIGDGSQLVALIYGRTREEQEANTNGISALPDLLAAGHEAVEGIREAVRIMDLMGRGGDARELARVGHNLDCAISRAEGRTNG